MELLFIRKCYIVYSDVLESRQIRRAFKLVNPKHEYQALVRNDNSLGQVSLLVCRAEIREHYFEFNKNLKNQKSQISTDLIFIAISQTMVSKLLSIYC